VSTKGTVRSGILRLSKGGKIVATGACMILLVIVALPILMIVAISFAQEGSWTWQLLPTAYTFENYAKLFSDPSIFEPIKNSFLMSLIAVVGCIIVGVNIAYVATKGVLRRSRFLVDIVATMPYAVPGTVVAIGLILAFNTSNVFSFHRVLVGTFWILPLAYFVRLFPLVVRSTTASLSQLDDSLIEAAAILGAGGWRKFQKVVLPIILPGIISGALLVVITALGEFVSSILLYTYSNRPIAVEILAQMRSYNFGAAAAYSVLLLVLIMVISYVASFLSKKGTTDIRL
jgi:iron(III) transport system permease protein